MTSQRTPVAVLGATGTVGQRFIELLQGHPWFELVGLAASEQHGGRPYAEATRWRLAGDMPPSVANMPVVACRPEALPDVKIVFSALPGEVELACQVLLSVHYSIALRLIGHKHSVTVTQGRG